MFQWLKSLILTAAARNSFNMDSLSERQILVLNAVRESSLKSLKEVFDPDCLEKDRGWFDYALVIESLMGRSKGVTRFLLKNGCRVRLPPGTKTSGIYKTPLCYAVESNNQEAVIKLTKLGASIDELDANARSPVFLAMEQNRYELLVKMLQQGSFDSSLDPRSRLDMEHYHIVCRINYLSYIEKFVARGFPIDQVSDSDLTVCNGETPLHFAVANKSLSTLSFLLKHCDNVRVKNSRGLTPLQLAFYNQLNNQENCIIYVWFTSSHFVPSEEEDKVIKKLLVAHLTSYFNPIDENGLTHFHISCTKNFPEVVQVFLDHGVDLNARLSQRFPKYPGCAPLHLAVHENCLDVAKLLVLNGADLNVTSNSLQTPLHLACLRGHATMVKLLVTEGASLLFQDHNGCTPVHLAFYKLPRDESLVGYLVERVPKDVNPIDSQGLSHFQVACSTDRLELISQFIENNVPINLDLNSTRIKYSGYSALHFAVAFNRREVVELLLKRGANARATTTRSGLTPLHLACMHNWNKFYELVLRDEDKCWTKNRDDQTKIIRLLLEYGSDPNAPDSSDMTALLQACTLDTFRSFCNELSPGELSYEASLKIRPALDEELQLRVLQMINVLVSHGAQLNPPRTNKHGSVLHLLLKETVFAESALIDVIQALLDLGADVNATNEWAMTPLHLAVTLGSEKVVRLLLDNGANVCARNKISSTPLHLAVGSICTAGELVIDVLLENVHCDVDARNIQGETPLHVAFSRKNVHAVKQLLKHGADVNVQDRSGSPTLYNSYDRFNFNRRDEDWLEIQRLVQDHVTMLGALGAYVSSKVRCHCETNLDEDFEEATGKLVARCTPEIEKMRLVKLDAYSSLLDVLRKHPRDFAKHTGNEVLRNIVEDEDLKTKFPIYGDLLRAKFRRGKFRKSLVQDTVNALDYVLNKRLPEFCLHVILRHLDNEALEKIIKAKGFSHNKLNEPATSVVGCRTCTNKRQRLH